MTTELFKPLVFLAISSVLAVIFLASCNPETPPEIAASNDVLLYVGTYTGGESEGIYVYNMNLDSGELSLKHTVSGVENPSYLAIHPDNKMLYAVNELMELDGVPGGGVSAFSIDPENGNLSFQNQVSSNGGAPCYLSVSNDKRWLYVANYMGGNVSAHALDKNGGLNAVATVMQHEGTGPSSRQEAPHAHSIMPVPGTPIVLSADLGADKVIIYRADSEKGFADPKVLAVESGAGPRHMAFHPTHNQLFVINELNATINSYQIDVESAEFTLQQSVPTLPADFAGENTCADLDVSPDGKFLYGTNRGHNSLVVYAIDASGRLSYVEHISCGGDWPRNFTMTPDGNYLLVANKKSNSIVVFKRDMVSGKLKNTGISTTVPAPVCLAFLE
ncbi:MAG: lactonase family protein [Calditrichia bacterium]